jgi:hypothetical protein
LALQLVDFDTKYITKLLKNQRTKFNYIKMN